MLFEQHERDEVKNSNTYLITGLIIKDINHAVRLTRDTNCGYVRAIIITNDISQCRVLACVRSRAARNVIRLPAHTYVYGICVLAQPSWRAVYWPVFYRALNGQFEQLVYVFECAQHASKFCGRWRCALYKRICPVFVCLVYRKTKTSML